MKQPKVSDFEVIVQEFNVLVKFTPTGATYDFMRLSAGGVGSADVTEGVGDDYWPPDVFQMAGKLAERAVTS
jgi:hypothetical protein